MYKKLKERTEYYSVKGLVRSEESKEKLGGDEDLVVGDITKPETIAPLFENVDYVIIVTSAVPKIEPGFDPSKGGRPTFYFEEGGTPELVRFIALL